LRFVFQKHIKKVAYSHLFYVFDRTYHKCYPKISKKGGEKMFKKLLCCFLTFAILTTTGLYGFAKEDDTGGTVKVFNLSPEQYCKFLNKEDTGLFKESDLNIYKYSIEGGSINVNCQYLDGTEKNFHTYSGISRINNLPVYESFINFLASTSNIGQYLEMEGITNVIVKDYYVFTVKRDSAFSDEFNVPLTAYLETNEGNFFITLNEYDYIWENGYHSYPDMNEINAMGDSEDYIYKLYKAQDYINKYQLKNGILKVNGQALNGDQPKFLANSAYIPLRDVLESLGCEIDWNGDSREILLTAGKNKMTLKLEDNGLMGIVDSKGNVNEWASPITHYVYDIFDGKTYLYYSTMYDVVRSLYGTDMKTDISFDDLTVSFAYEKFDASVLSKSEESVDSYAPYYKFNGTATTNFSIDSYIKEYNLSYSKEYEWKIFTSDPKLVAESIWNSMYGYNDINDFVLNIYYDKGKDAWAVIPIPDKDNLDYIPFITIDRQNGTITAYKKSESN